MKTQPRDLRHGRGPHRAGKPRRLRNFVENDLIRRVSFDEYKNRVQNVYGGPRGAVLAAASLVSLHLPLGARLLRKRRFDLRGCKHILDVGSGAGQIAQHLLKYADRDARITCTDLSHEMLRRARHRLKSEAPLHVVADLARLPFADGTFDCVTCGYVLEHLPDARLGLAELYRVMQPGGRLLLLTTEDTFSGAWTSRLWACRTYNRRELHEVSDQLGLRWRKELWFSQLHRMFRAGGIVVEIEKPVSAVN